MILRAVFILFIYLIPSSVFSQTSPTSDSTEDRLIKTFCDNKIFDRVEIPSDFKFGSKAVEDRIAKHFRDAGLQLRKGKATYSLIITTNGQVIRIRKLSGHHENESEVIKALELTSDLWTIAKQNSRLVCNYVRLEVEFRNKTVKVKKPR